MFADPGSGTHLGRLRPHRVGLDDVPSQRIPTDKIPECHCVIHLAWLIQPGRDLDTLQAVNVEVPVHSGALRVKELATGIGSRQ